MRLLPLLPVLFAVGCSAAPPAPPSQAQVSMTAAPAVATQQKPWIQAEIAPIGLRAWFPEEPEPFSGKEGGIPVRGFRLDASEEGATEYAAYWSTTKHNAELADVETAEDRFGDAWKDLERREGVVRNGWSGTEHVGRGPKGPMAVRVVPIGKWLFVLEATRIGKGKEVPEASRFFDAATIDPPWIVEPFPQYGATLGVPAAATREDEKSPPSLLRHKFAIAEAPAKSFDLMVLADRGSGTPKPAEARVRDAIARIEREIGADPRQTKVAARDGRTIAELEGEASDKRRVRARAVADRDRVFLLTVTDSKADPLPEGVADRYFDSLWFH